MDMGQADGGDSLTGIPSSSMTSLCVVNNENELVHQLQVPR